VQHQLVVGTLLGDGAMRCKTNALLEINHSAKQRAYVDWKYRHLADLVITPPKERCGNAGRIAYRFVTRSLPGPDAVFSPVLRERAKGGARGGARSTDTGGLVHG
jgi:hypothetical protein